MDKLKIGIVGCGTIGSALAQAVVTKYSEHAVIAALCDCEPKKAENLSSALKTNPDITDLGALVIKSDFIIEAASKDIVPEVLAQALAHNKDVMIMSVGGIIENMELLDKIRASSVKLYIPSGAIGGIDAIKAALIGDISSVMITTRKPPKGLAGAPYILEKNIDVMNIKEERVIFEGTAIEAIKAFPSNINVSAILSLAALGPSRTKVRIVLDPKSNANIHQIDVSGNFGELRVQCKNKPSVLNPKTSALAIFSAEAVLLGLFQNIRVGT